MPFGLKGLPKTYTRLVDILFGPEVMDRVFIHMDDRINRVKCEFGCSNVTYLGYILNKDGLRPDPERIRPVLEMPATQDSWHVWLVRLFH